MCGIAGMINLQLKTVDEAIVKNMNDSIHHRGPDDEGFYFKPGVGLAHRRLSIIDIASGHQPMTEQNETLAIVFNGEIYNHQDLARDLKQKGHTFSTKCDTEVILKLYIEHGIDCLKHLRGMFAFAIWDGRTNEFFMARDRLGIKPIYFSHVNDNLLFASELKAVMKSNLVESTLNPQAVEDYFSLGYIPEPKSIYTQVAKLLPGHYVHLKLNEPTQQIQQNEYWDLSYDPAAPTIDNGELNSRLSEAVKIRMEAEVPLGAFLSGGVDSSAIVAHMAKLQDSSVNTCSIGFDEKAYDEMDYANQIAEKFKTNHQSKTVNADDFDLIDEITNWYDEPFADPSSLPTFRVCELAKGNVTVVLSGDGGDELFAGYRNHMMHNNEQKIRSLLPLAIRKPVFGLLAKVYPKLDWAPRFLRAKTTFQSLAMAEDEAFHNTMSILRKESLNKLYSTEFKSQLNGYSSLDVFRHYFKKVVGWDALKKIQYLDFKTYLPGDILTKVDRASMANSIEVRVPLLDHKFVEWAFQMDSSVNLVNGEGKAEFKKQLESELPDNILYRPKMGFRTPLEQWFKGPLKDKAQRLLLSSKMQDSKFFDMKYIEKMLNEHISGIKNHDTALWSLLIFSSFLEKSEK